MKYILSIVLIVSIIGYNAFSQPNTLEIQIKNHPGNYIVLEKIIGDNIQPVDTIFLRPAQGKITKKGEYNFPENSESGMYRLNLGKTTYAQVMDEPPQQLDFIYNDENIILETDFEAPKEKTLVVLSEENRVWYEFLQRERNIQDKIDDLVLEIEYLRRNETSDEEKLQHIINQYNDIQKQREEFISELVARYSNMFAAKLISMYREPFLDGNLMIQQRRENFQTNYFKLHEFTDESLINTSVYTDKIFRYLTSFNRPGYSKEKLEKEYIKAVDIVLTNTNKNQNVYEFILSNIIHGFEVLKMENVLNYIAENYSGAPVQSEDNSIPEKKPAAQKIKIGTTVPDFTSFDHEGFFVDLPDVQQDKTLILFWASWCSQSIEMMPHIKKWADSQNNLGVVALSLDTSKPEWLNAVENLGIENWTNLSDLKKWDGEVVTKYNVSATPTMIIIDRERKVLANPSTIQELINLDLE